MRTVIVHSAEHVQSALAAAEVCKSSITLQSAPDAIFYAGPACLMSMFEAAREQYPDIAATFIIDCGNGHAEAIEALSVGHRHIRSSATDDIKVKLAAIAAENGVGFYDGPYEALDLHAIRGTKDAIIAWLKRDI